MKRQGGKEEEEEEEEEEEDIFNRSNASEWEEEVSLSFGST